MIATWMQPTGLRPSEVRAAFRDLLNRPRLPLQARVDEARCEDGLVTERLSFVSDRNPDGTEERVPALVVRPAGAADQLPAVIVLHGTGMSKERMRGWLVKLARLGLLGVAIDARHHGERAGGAPGTARYEQAIVRAWRDGAHVGREYPLYFDTCWDLWRTIDYLGTRGDVDSERLGMIGFSMGGIHTWLAAAVDERVRVAVPALAVQSFCWGLENERWQGRASTILAAHEAAARDLGEPEVTGAVCRALWDKVVPGILDRFDGPSMLRLFAGRPLLILNGELDPNCPLEGARLAVAAAKEAYRQAGAGDRLRFLVGRDIGHALTPEQKQAALDWLLRWLAVPPAPGPARGASVGAAEYLALATPTST
jgi:predicted esterase